MVKCHDIAPTDLRILMLLTGLLHHRTETRPLQILSRDHVNHGSVQWLASYLTSVASGLIAPYEEHQPHDSPRAAIRNDQLQDDAKNRQIHLLTLGT